MDVFNQRLIGSGCSAVRAFWWWQSAPVGTRKLKYPPKWCNWRNLILQYFCLSYGQKTLGLSTRGQKTLGLSTRHRKPPLSAYKLRTQETSMFSSSILWAFIFAKWNNSDWSPCMEISPCRETNLNGVHSEWANLQMMRDVLMLQHRKVWLSLPWELASARLLFAMLEGNPCTWAMHFSINGYKSLVFCVLSGDSRAWYESKLPLQIFLKSHAPGVHWRVDL